MFASNFDIPDMDVFKIIDSYQEDIQLLFEMDEIVNSIQEDYYQEGGDLEAYNEKALEEIKSRLGKIGNNAKNRIMSTGQASIDSIVKAAQSATRSAKRLGRDAAGKLINLKDDMSGKVVNAVNTCIKEVKRALRKISNTPKLAATATAEKIYTMCPSVQKFMASKNLFSESAIEIFTEGMNPQAAIGGLVNSCKSAISGIQKSISNAIGEIDISGSAKKGAHRLSALATSIYNSIANKAQSLIRTYAISNINKLKG